MVEGHQVARTAAAHRATLVGKKYRATSPNGRFCDGARSIDGRKLVDVQSVGKNLFYFFESPDEGVGHERQTVAVHFGMSGRARVSRLSSEPETTPTTRLRLVEDESEGVGRDDRLTLHVAAMTLVHSPDLSLWSTKRANLGPDPLREDGDPEVFFANVEARKNRGIGYLLMEQSVVAGIGNIYRAEVCHLSRVHPETPAGHLTREELWKVWEASVRTLRDGYELGSIVTVRDGEREAPFDPSARRFVYNRERCARCGDRVVSFDISNRTAYACLSCQPLRRSAEAALTPARKKEVDSASPAKLFKSRCAPDDGGDPTTPLPPSKMTVAQLRSVLEANGLDSKGRRAELVQRLKESSRTPATTKTTKRERLDDEEDALTERLSSSLPCSLPAVGTRGLVPATPAAAAAEKRRAGEKGNVEHVAQSGDDLATAFGPVTPSPKKNKESKKTKRKQGHES